MQNSSLDPIVLLDAQNDKNRKFRIDKILFKL